MSLIYHGDSKVKIDMKPLHMSPTPAHYGDSKVKVDLKTLHTSQIKGVEKSREKYEVWKTSAFLLFPSGGKQIKVEEKTSR